MSTENLLGHESLRQLFDQGQVQQSNKSLRDSRAARASAWLSQDFPARSTERWRYTDLSALRKSRFKAFDRNGLTDRLPAVQLGLNRVEVVLCNGVFRPELSRLPQDGSISVVRASSEVPGAGAIPQSTSENYFSNLNDLFFDDYVKIQVADGVALEEPIRVIHWNDLAQEGDDDGLTLVSPRLFIGLGKNSQAVVLEQSVSSANHRGVRNAVTEIDLARGARLSFGHLHEDASAAISISQTRVTQARQSLCEVTNLSFGARLARHELVVQLNEEGAGVMLNGLYLPSEREHIDHATRIEHRAPQTNSDQLYKGILSAQSRAVFNGQVCMNRSAVKSSAAQVNRNLLLSRRAEVDTKPELEIDVDDVKASHGATVGQLDREHLFYLEARAIEPAQAVQMLALGFATDVVYRVQNEFIQTAMMKAVTGRLRDLKVEVDHE